MGRGTVIDTRSKRINNIEEIVPEEKVVKKQSRTKTVTSFPTFSQTNDIKTKPTSDIVIFSQTNDIMISNKPTNVLASFSHTKAIKK